MLGIFPASGGIGGSTLKHLLNNVDGSNVTAIVRRPENVPQGIIQSDCKIRVADYDFLETLDHAFDGITYLNLISYASIDHEYRFKVHKAAIDAARKSGVTHIFYSSLGFGGDGDLTSVAHVMQAHLDTEKYLTSIAAEDVSFTYTVIRVGLYTESFPLYTAFFDLKNPLELIKLPHDGEAPGISWAKQDELGEGVALLLSSFVKSPEKFPYMNKTILLSGPRAVSLKESIETIGRVLGKPIQLKQTSIEEYAIQPSVKNANTYGAGDQAIIWATAFEAIRRGEAGVVTPILGQILGREPEPFEQTIKGML